MGVHVQSPFQNKISSRNRNAREEHMNIPTLSLRTLDKKVDNLDRELWEEIKGVESKVMENMTSIETNILDAVTKSSSIHNRYKESIHQLKWWRCRHTFV
ncbi:hypothetical protein PRUPE_3G147600 [Prunus persica]|uniref:Uncharacterized protein n=1 Tax=Prunus persica TaxID=3760 RepID=A0A251Q073_PRUPE|nr:hypothetical protein PRUPE_3G147600 [Prunus persica]